jgi:hypothetical protein
MVAVLKDSVHGGPTEKPITVTKEHEEGLERMDKLSEFAPLHASSTDTIMTQVYMLT